MTRFGGGRWDGGNRGFNDGRGEGGGQDVLKDNMFSKIMSKVLMDKGILSGRGKEVFFFIFTILGFIEGDVGEGLKAVDGGGGDGSTSDDILWAVRDVEEGEVLNIVKSGPDELRRWRDDGLEDAGSDIERTWVVPSVVRALEDFNDGGSGVSDVLLVYVIKGRPRGNGDVGEGRGDNGGGL